MKLVLAVLAMAFALTGCKPSTTEERGAQAEQTRSVTKDTVKTVTGYNDMKTYERTKANIKNIDGQRRSDNAEAQSLNE